MVLTQWFDVDGWMDDDAGHGSGLEVRKKWLTQDI